MSIQRKFLTPRPPKLKTLTEEQIRILKIVSRNNEYQLDDLLHSTSERVENVIKAYYEEEPLIDDLNNQGIQSNILNDLKYKDFDNKSYEKAIPILIKWLKKEDISDNLKSAIISVLVERPISKQYSFDIIIDIYEKNADKNVPDKFGFQPSLFIAIGNGLIRWVDDKYAAKIFDILKNEKLRLDSFLLSSLANFKKFENRKKAIKVLIEELQKPNLNNGRLLLIISILKKLEAIEARNLIYLFTQYPQNYPRNEKLSLEENYFVTDTNVRNEAKKAIAAFDKIKK